MIEKYEDIYENIELDAQKHFQEVYNLFSLEEKKLIGSLQSQSMKAFKNINATLTDLKKLQRVISTSQKEKGEVLLEKIEKLISDCNEIISIMQDPSFMKKLSEIDRNSTMFRGRAKDSSKLSSKDFN